MGESRQDCPICAREPGEFHTTDCARFSRPWREPFDWLAYAKLPVVPLKLRDRKLFQDPPKPSASPGKPKCWRLAPIDPRPAMRPAAVREQNAQRLKRA